MVQCEIQEIELRVVGLVEVITIVDENNPELLLCDPVTVSQLLHLYFNI